MEVKNDLVPELELNIIPTKDGNLLQVELMHKDFIKFLKKYSFSPFPLQIDIVFIAPRQLRFFIERLQKTYKEYCKE